MPPPPPLTILLALAAASLLPEKAALLFYYAAAGGIGGVGRAAFAAGETRPAVRVIFNYAVVGIVLGLLAGAACMAKMPDNDSLFYWGTLISGCAGFGPTVAIQFGKRWLSKGST